MVNSNDKPAWFWAAGLTLLDHAVSDGSILAVLERVLRQRIRRIETEGSNDSAGDGFDLVDFECERIEEMLGTAFIACQIDITSVVSRCALLLESGELGTKPVRPRDLKQELVSKLSPSVAGTHYTQVAAIDAFANYFKHVDEWPNDWNPRNPNARKTAETVRKLGAQRGSSGNMRTGFEAILGHTRFDEVSALGAVVGAWAKGLRQEYERLLRGKGLLPPTATPEEP